MNRRQQSARRSERRRRRQRTGVTDDPPPPPMSEEELRQVPVLERWYDPSTCWEDRCTDNDKELRNIGVCSSAWGEIPAWTRIDVQIPTLVCVTDEDRQLSLHQVEKHVPRLYSSVPSKHSFEVACCSPLTSQLMGYVYLPNEPTSRKDTKASVLYPGALTTLEDVSQYNCMIVVDVFHDWTLMVYTTRHVRKGEEWKVCPGTVFVEDRGEPNRGKKQTTVQHTESNDKDDNDVCVYLRTFLPSSVHMPRVERFLRGDRSCENSMTFKELRWNEMLLAGVIDLMEKQSSQDTGKEQKTEMYRIAMRFNERYTRSRESSPLVLCCFMTEALCNGSHCGLWSRQIVVKALMRESMYAQ